MFLALDLGGTNFRVLLLELQNGQLVREDVQQYHIRYCLFCHTNVTIDPMQKLGLLTSTTASIYTLIKDIEIVYNNYYKFISRTYFDISTITFISNFKIMLSLFMIMYLIHKM